MKFALSAAAALAVGLFASSATAGDQDFTLINQTGYVIKEVYVSAAAADDWEEDVLGVDVLGNGVRTKISFPRDANACMWDLKVVYEDDETAEWNGFNLCEVSVIAIKYNRGTGETSAEYE